MAQLEELQLITCSLLPGESFAFSEHCEAWSKIHDTYSEDPDQVDPNHLSTLPPACFHVSLDKWNLWFEVELPRRYPEPGVKPIITVKGEDITRAEQEMWKSVVAQKMDEVLGTGSGYPVYELLSSHLMPMLHEYAEAENLKRLAVTTEAASSSELEQLAKNPSANRGQQLYHALFTSHHLVSPTKRRNLQQWASSLALSGFAKVGYPGIIYAQGEKENIEEFLDNVKAMQWLALKLRFSDPVGEGEEKKGNKGRVWGEFQKIGEVMEEMRRIGRERYLTDMGIGSTGPSR